MSEKPMVYVVTDGEYSAYSIVGVCSTKEKAEEMKQQYAAENRIEEYPLDFVPEHPPGMVVYRVYMKYSGDVCTVERGDPTDFTDVVDDDGSEVCLEEEWGRVHTTFYKVEPSFFESTYFKPAEVVMTMWARDKDHAIKIAGDTRVRLMAEERWKQPE